MRNLLIILSVMMFTLAHSQERDTLHLGATLYHPVASQCSGNPLITADGSNINLAKLKSGQLRWVAVSRDLLREKKLRHGDTLVIVSPKTISGKWIVHDTMGARHQKMIDFLVHPQNKMSVPKSVKAVIVPKRVI